MKGHGYQIEVFTFDLIGHGEQFQFLYQVILLKQVVRKITLVMVSKINWVEKKIKTFTDQEIVTMPHMWQ